MSEAKKKWLKTGIWVLVIVIAGIVVWLTSFHNADQLTIVDGKVQGIKSTWLVGKFGADQPYVKTADVSAPRGYKTITDAEDLDGDPITTDFLFRGKDAEKNPGEIRVWAAAAADQPQGESFETGGKQGVLSSVLEEGEEIVRQFWMDSPYENGKIVTEVRLGSGAEEAELTALIAAMAEQITPGKRMSPLAAEFKLNFLDDNRWQYLTNGLLVTLEITLAAVLLGILFGVLVAAVRSTWDQNSENMRKGPGKTLLRGLNGFCKLYLTVIRGTPVVIQLMIMYYIIFSASRNGVLIAMLAFGINSGAYVAEIIRGGIMAVDRGQLEAGRSLGFNYVKTMWFIIVPQAMKSVLPALANEFIVLLKETSVAGYVAVKDLTKGGDIIRGVTYSAFMPLIAVALIYLVMVIFFTKLVARLERRLRSSDH